MTSTVKFVAAPDEACDCDCCSGDAHCAMFSVITLRVYERGLEWVASYDDEDFVKLLDELRDDMNTSEVMENTFEVPRGQKSKDFLAQLRNDSRFKVVESLYGED